MSFPGMNFKEIADVGKKTFEFPKELKSKPMFDKELPVKVNETESEKVEDTYFSTYVYFVIRTHVNNRCVFSFDVHILFAVCARPGLVNFVNCSWICM